MLNKRRYECLKSISILIIEDDKKTLDEICSLFELYCYRCYCTQSPKEALELYKKHSPDVVITNYGLPYMNGLELSKEIKKINPLAPIIINSMFADKEIFLEAIEIGISGYVTKPTNKDKLIETVHKISQNIIKDKQLKKQNNLLEVVINEISNPFVVIDLEYNVLFINECAKSKIQPPTLKPLSKCYNLVYGFDTPCHEKENQNCPLEMIKKDGFASKITHIHENENGEKKYLEISPKPLKDENGDIYAFVEVIHDITDYKNESEELRYFASHDVLTGLPNRALLSDRIQQTMIRVDRYGGMFALFFIDLDHFKEVNDEYGHYVGDILLKEVAKRIKKHIRKSDTLARIGGDEFVLLVETKSKKDTEALAHEMLEAIKQKFYIGSISIQAGFSMGINIYTPNCQKTEEYLMLNADKAMYRAKKDGRLNYKFYE